MTPADSPPAKPSILPLDPTSIPDELRKIDAWVGWRPVWKDGRWTKEPFDLKNGRHASSIDRSTWVTFEFALANYRRWNCDGIGLCRTDDYMFIDLDGVLTEADQLKDFPWAEKTLAALKGKAYLEKSVSGTGLHGIGRGKLPPGADRKELKEPGHEHTGVSFYDTGRFFTFTGAELFESGPITDLTAELARLHSELFPATERRNGHHAAAHRTLSLSDAEIIEKATQAQNGAKFSRLWSGDTTGYPKGSQNEADLALCDILAFWTRCDAARMDALFRQSGLMREKWAGSRDDYRERTINKAIANCHDVYEPPGNGHYTAASASDGPLGPDPPSNDADPTAGSSADEGAAATNKPPKKRRPRVIGSDLNDTGNAERLANAHGDDLIYCKERRSFYVWSGKRWVFDEFLEVEKRAEQTIRSAFAEAGAIKDAAEREQFLQFLNKSLSKNWLSNMMHLTKKKVRAVSATELDANPWLLNVANGTVDLRTGELRPHNREDLISKLIPLEYDPAAQCPLFLASIYRSMGDAPSAPEEAKDKAHELAEYLHLLFGCAATGKTEKILVVFYGQGGNNGKTTLLSIISKALGSREYSAQINIDSLMVDPRGAGNSNAINSDLSDLQGARFVFTSEVERGQRLSLSRVKYLTGLSSIKARRLRENWIEFEPVHKIFLDCNDRPVISNPSDPIWNRVVCVPFDFKIPDEEIDTDFLRKLEAELPGILAWLVKGASAYHQQGLTHRPAGVQASTEEYRQKSDRLREFIEDRCSLNPYAWVSSKILLANYEDWCRQNGEKNPLEGNEFAEQIRAKGCWPKRKIIMQAETRGWAGIALKSVESET